MNTLATLYIGTYSVRDSVGIYQVALDTANGAMRLVSSAPACDAAFLALSPDRATVYAAEEGVSRHDCRPGVSAYEIVQDGSLALRNRLPVPGLAPCHLAITRDWNWIVTSNYTDGSHTVLAARRPGEFRAAPGALFRVVQQTHNVGTAGPHKRQEASHAHCAEIYEGDPDETWVYTCDLGLDRLICFRLDSVTGMLEERPDEGAILPPGSGPRHCVQHPMLPILYVFGELDSTIYVYLKTPAGKLDKQWNGHRVLTLAQAMPTLPAAFRSENWGAAIKIRPDGNLVTVSNRGRDVLVSFRIDPVSGLLSPLGEAACGGSWPRDFAYVGNDVLVVANERSDNLAAFRVSLEGLIEAIASPEARLTIPSPTCVLAALPRE